MADFRDATRAKAAQNGRAVALLETAIEQLKADQPDEDTETKQARVRGAATLVHASALEIGSYAGFLEATLAAEVAGVLEGSDDDG